MKIFNCLILVIISQCLSAQIQAITDKGREVVLHQDSTWSYKEDITDEIIEIPKNNKLFHKSEDNTFQVKSNIVNVGVWIDPKEWTFEKSTINQFAEYQFIKRSINAWGMLITEPVTIELSMLGNIAFSNAKAGATELTKDYEEYRTVNGVEVLCMKMSGKIQGIDLTYLGYYYSDDNGSSQLLTWCYSKDEIELKEESLKLLNGFVVLKE